MARRVTLATIGAHAVLFLAAILVTWVAGLLPILILRPGAYGKLTPLQILGGIGPPNLESFLRGWPVLFMIALVQGLVFRSVKKRPRLVFLSVVAVLWSAYAWSLSLSNLSRLT
jgi:hypothetical protein